MQLYKRLLLLIPFTLGAFAGCATQDPVEAEEEGEAAAPLTGSCAGTSTGPCAGTPIDTAVQCAIRLGARVLSYYRSPAQQECVRRQNHCTDRCSGTAGCHPIAAGCTTSPHTQCRAVDLVHDGAPLTRAQLASCGLRKVHAPHDNHYDLVTPSGAPASTPSPAPSASSSGKPGSSSGSAPSAPTTGGTCHSTTLGADVPAGTCVQRDDDDQWYVCDGSNPTAWPMVTDPADTRCTSCPQLGGSCDQGPGEK